MTSYKSTTATLDRPAEPDFDRPARHGEDRLLRILGVGITDASRSRAIQMIEQMILQRDGRTRVVLFVNAHTLNLAAVDSSYRRVLNRADRVLGDGTGVRWAGRIQGVRVQDNLNGTDFVPDLLRRTAGRKYRLFLLGADEETIRRAADYAARTFAGWEIVGFHHGYLDEPSRCAEAIGQIRESRPDLVLVGMGNPRQERWIHEHRDELRVPVCMAVGGLFDFWAKRFSRAPRWLRKLGHEWIWRLVQQPRDKGWRYLVGNPVFLLRALAERVRQGLLAAAMTGTSAPPAAPFSGASAALQSRHECDLSGDRSAARGLLGGLWELVGPDARHGSAG